MADSPESGPLADYLQESQACALQARRAISSLRATIERTRAELGKTRELLVRTHDREQSLKLGAVDYPRKEYEFAKFLTVVKNICHRLTAGGTRLVA